MAEAAAPVRSRFLPALPVDLGVTLGHLGRGPRDPVMRFLPGGAGVVRTMRTPDGPATLEIRPDGRHLTTAAWGPGAGWATRHAPVLCGSEDSLDGFTPHHRLVQELHRHHPGLRIGRTASVVDALVVAVLEQKWTGKEAVRAWTRLVSALGEVAPGPHPGLRLAVAPERLAQTPYWTFHTFGVEKRRADLLRLIGARGAWLEDGAVLGPPAAEARMRSLPGVGAWTAAEVRLHALGDADAVSVGDYNLPRVVSWGLAAEREADDARMLELLQPYRGHRGRVIRLLLAGQVMPERRGPRMTVRDITCW